MTKRTESDAAAPGDALRTYEGKRDFGISPEPRGRGRRAAEPRFVVQKHAARRLHYDFRLELDGVLKSWAVTRGPSLVVGERRLAVETEDHPLSYLGFEGVIPAGQYGGGSVVVWDLGTWRPEGDPRAGHAAGKLTFTLAGRKLSGRWHLVRTRPRGGKQQWLLLKGEDEAARPAEAPDILEEAPASVLSGRTNADLEAGGALRPDHAAREARAAAGPARRLAPRGAKAALLPVFVAPCLATLAAAAPTAADWLHEIKFDGYRLQARIDGDAVALLTRSGLDWTDRFAPLAAALRGLGLPSALLDGEAVVEDGAGVSQFSALQADLKAGRTDRLAYHVFDILYLDGRDLRPLPLTERKAALSALLAALPAGGPLRLSEHVMGEGEAMARHACRLGLEGIVSKRADSPYASGRCGSWLKVKCTERQEFVIGGYLPSTVARRAVGSLVLGLYEADGAFRHVGRVGTGFSADVAHDLWTALDPLRQAEPPFAAPLPAEARRGGAVWVRPELVAEAEFRGITGEGQLRHAAFRGLREDKPAREVVREAPASRVAPAPVAALTHPDRVLWDDVGLTKEGLAAYLAAVAPRILREVAGRPLSLLRGPDGTRGKTFFQKHAWAGLDAAAVRSLRVGDDDALVIEGVDGLMALVQASVLEIHPWGSRADDPDRPDRIVFDLDPGEGVGWPAVVAGARAVRDRLDALGHAGFVKTSGGKGLHVVVPLLPRAGWDVAKGFARDLATALERDAPDRFTATLAKPARHGRIFVDYLRNGRGATAVAAYSPRARPGAPVATPLAWQDLATVASGDAYRVDTVLRRLDAAPDPWDGMEAAARPLEPPRRGRRAAAR